MRGVLIHSAHSEAFVPHVTSACGQRGREEQDVASSFKGQVGSESVSPIQSLSRV